MDFSGWLNESIWYHGTAYGDAIRQSGRLDVSTSGGGQRGLMGVWLTKDPTYAQRYAASIKEKGSRPEILRVEIPDNLKIADIDSVERKARKSLAGHPVDADKARWKFLGFDADDFESMAPVRDMQPYAATKLLKQSGYDGALIPNTIELGGRAELVIFDPAHIKIVGNYENI